MKTEAKEALALEFPNHALRCFKPIPSDQRLKLTEDQIMALRSVQDINPDKISDERLNELGLTRDMVENNFLPFNCLGPYDTVWPLD